MAIFPLSHSETKSEPHLHLQDSLCVVGEKTSAREMADLEGRMLVAEAAAGARRMNKAMIVKIAAVSGLAMLLLTAASVSIAHYDRSHDTFLKVCVVTHITTICLLASSAAMARTPAERRCHVESAVGSIVHLAVNLYLVLAACPSKVQGAA